MCPAEQRRAHAHVRAGIGGSDGVRPLSHCRYDPCKAPRASRRRSPAVFGEGHHMKKMLLSAFLATAGCVGGPAPDQIGTTQRAVTVASPDGDDDHGGHPLPHLRYVPPGQAGGGAGGGGTGGGNGGPTWRALTNQPSANAGAALLLTVGSVM